MFDLGYHLKQVDTIFERVFGKLSHCNIIAFSDVLWTGTRYAGLRPRESLPRRPRLPKFQPRLTYGVIVERAWARRRTFP